MVKLLCRKECFHMQIQSFVAGLKLLITQRRHLKGIEPQKRRSYGKFYKNKTRIKADLVYLVAGEIFVRYTEEHFPLLLGREMRLFL